MRLNLSLFKFTSLIVRSDISDATNEDEDDDEEDDEMFSTPLLVLLLLLLPFSGS